MMEELKVMPGWNLHVHFANDLIKQYGVENPIDFIIGSVFPDCPWLEPAVAAISGIKERLHYYHEGVGLFNNEVGISEWLRDNRRIVPYSDFAKGVLSHIILDNHINTLWNAITVVEGVDMISLPHGKTVTQKGAAHIKWEETSRFDNYKYGDYDVFNMYQKYALSDAGFDFIMNEYDLTRDEVNSIIPAVKRFIKGITFEGDFTYTIPALTYDHILYTAEIIWRSLTSLC